jgi:acyl-homoserine-lactone acylase
MKRTIFYALCLLLAQACSDSGGGFNPNEPELPEPELSYQADIVWTEYGIPHVTSQSWGGLGYGYAYAFARDNYCVVMKEFVRSEGESARYLAEEGDLNLDLVLKLTNSNARMREILEEDMPAYIAQLAEGYAAGLNRYLNETGVDNLAEGEEGCRGAEWVREVDAVDVAQLLHKRILRGSSEPMADFMVAAEPPVETASLAPTKYSPAAMAELQQLARLEPREARDLIGLPQPETVGSNAYGIGGDASQGNSGVLYGNPHFPWQGPDRFYMSHLTIPGQYDVMGASLHGIPLVVLGFNKDVAWSHTVSTADRFTFHELTLNSENLLEYIYDGEVLEMEPVTVSAQTVDGDGLVQTVEHTFYQTRFGPIVDLGGLNPALGGWPNIIGSLIAMQDANLENLRSTEQWADFGKAANLDELKEALQAVGIPWVNTIAADRFGNGFYGDVSTVPHVTDQKLNDCVRGLIAPLLLDAGYVMLDGSDSACDLGSDEDAPVAGVFGYDSLPKLTTSGYGANANDSYWLANPDQLLSGFPFIIGDEEIQQSYRTRLTFVQAEERLAGSDGLGAPGFTNENVREILTSARNYPAELMKDELVGLCEGVDWSVFSDNPAEVASACEILDAWDTRHTIDSVGGHIFFEFWRTAYYMDNIWAVPFDPADPVNTPNTLDTGDAQLVSELRQALADGVQVLLDNGIALDASWGEVQFEEKNGERIPIHGGSGGMMFSVISSNLVAGEGYSNIGGGNSYIQAVSWDETDCPDANAILTYSQSTDPASAHYADATRLYSQSDWIDMPFCEAARDAQEIGRMSIEE